MPGTAAVALLPPRQRTAAISNTRRSASGRERPATSTASANASAASLRVIGAWWSGIGRGVLLRQPARQFMPTGPLTNIAIFCQQHPELLDKVKEIVWMGGSTTRGKATPYAEFNAAPDPEALDVVLSSGLPFTRVGLNSTHQALITSGVLERIDAVGNATSAFAPNLDVERFWSMIEQAVRVLR